MKKLFNLNPKTIVIFYMLIDIICTGAGMGVPIFCILFGFPLGWYIAKRIFISSGHSSLTNSRILKFSALAAAFTFLIMLVIWGPTVRFLFDPTFDFKNFGHPMILFDPKISFIGWQVLMIFISPFLQLLTTIFVSFLTLSKQNSSEQI